ncbi:MAG: hypothetical protein JWP38_3526, partial [Herbaspirillum sp.]|nr:hypothetical protein [Herbaspirillum sp.]
GTAKGNPDLVKAIRDGVDILQRNGTMKTIYDRYHVNYGLAIKPEILTN